MNTKNIITLVAKIFFLTLILLFCFILAALISGISDPPADSLSSQDNNGSIMLTLLISSFIEVLIISYIILRSRWTGWKLIGAVFLSFYGSMTVIAQIESIIYLPEKLPHTLILKLFFMGLIMTTIFVPIAVLMLGKMKETFPDEKDNFRLVMPKSEWILKLFILTLIYLFLYYSFGYYIAWKNPVVRTYYGGTDPGNFIAQLYFIWKSTPWMFPLQAIRALLWIILVLPLIRMLKGNSWELSFVMAIFFSVWSLQLLIPNPYMPAEVASAHLIETLFSNFIFGWILGWLMSKKHSTIREIFKST